MTGAPLITEDARTESGAGVSLRELAVALSEYHPLIEGDAEVRVTGVRQDSRSVGFGELFAARSGASANGALFAEDAVERGAKAILTESGLALPNLSVPVLRVTQVRRAIAAAAEFVYGLPSQALPVIGVTGTNGKTTTCFLLEHALSTLGAKPARLGTLGFAFSTLREPEGHTTPEADEISRLLSRSRRAGATHFVMEVSSHALSQERVAALSFEVAAFTNLTQDHLDFHGSIEAYAAAKARLFTELRPRKAVINVDDPLGASLARWTPAAVTRVSRAVEAEIRVFEERLDASGIHARISAFGATLELTSRLLGAHNLENLLVALGTLMALGYDADKALSALATAPAVPGRLERCDAAGDDVVLAVDYAHTPDALERVLLALRPLTAGKLHCVFGCGGDRDPGKRVLMGSAVARLADSAVITNDNPRTEAPERIAEAVAAGFAGRTTPFIVELDRALAIQRAVLGAEPSDTVLIAGKGHENHQIFGTELRPFDDREEARRALTRRRQTRPGAR